MRAFLCSVFVYLPEDHFIRIYQYILIDCFWQAVRGMFIFDNKWRFRSSCHIWNHKVNQEGQVDDRSRASPRS